MCKSVARGGGGDRARAASPRPASKAPRSNWPRSKQGSRFQGPTWTLVLGQSLDPGRLRLGASAPRRRLPAPMRVALYPPRAQVVEHPRDGVVNPLAGPPEIAKAQRRKDRRKEQNGWISP